MHVVQITNEKAGRRLAIVDGPRLHVLAAYQSLFDLARHAEASGTPIAQLAGSAPVEDRLDYEAILAGAGSWRLLPAFDRPGQPACCLVSGTGLTHRGSAQGRDSMHGGGAVNAADETDSMRMFRWGVEGGRPAPGAVGAPPEWFFKGTGTILRAHGQELQMPRFGESGGEESEIAGLYITGVDGRPRRVGYATGNEFSDHVFEKRNYLYLAHSKLRQCSIGPEALIGEELPPCVAGTVSVEREGAAIWSKEIRTGSDNMCHSLANLEHHHFKYAAHWSDFDAHVHFFGAAALSFSAGVRLRAGDWVSVSWPALGRPLRNRISAADDSSGLVAAAPL